MNLRRDVVDLENRRGYVTAIGTVVIISVFGGTLCFSRMYDRQAGAENRPASRHTNNPDFASLLKRLDKDRNGVTTVEEIVEGFGEFAEKKGVYHHEYSFTLPDGSRQSLLIDLDYRER